MGQCFEKTSDQTLSMSHNSNSHHSHSSISTKHVKKKAKQDAAEQHQSSSNIRSSYRQVNTTTLEPRRDLPLHKIPELLAKITGTLSSTLSASTSSADTTSAIKSSSSSSSTPTDRRQQFFEHYADVSGGTLNNHQLMSLDGILRLCNDLTIEPDSYEVLLLCFLCRARQMYSLTKEEFFVGLRALGNHVDNLLDLRTRLFNYDVSSYEQEFYTWTYHYGLIDGQRCLTTSNAISLWRLFYSKATIAPKILERWLTFLEQDETAIASSEVPKSITCDTWTVFPQFAKFIETNDFEAYDDSEAWPCLFDSFVEYELDHHKKNNKSS